MLVSQWALWVLVANVCRATSLPDEPDRVSPDSMVRNTYEFYDDTDDGIRRAESVRIPSITSLHVRSVERRMDLDASTRSSTVQRSSRVSRQALADMVAGMDPTTLPRRRHTPEILHPVVLSNLSPRMRALAMAQPAIDAENDAYTPQLETDFEDVPELGRIELGHRIGQSDFGVVFTVKDHPELVIKYQSNCDSLDQNVHPLMVDFWLGSIAADAGVAARPHFVSPPVRLILSNKTESVMTEVELIDCRRDGGLVRFMVMDHAGDCLGGGVRRTQAYSMAMGAKLIRSLQILHAAEIFHGDIHAGNVCFSRTSAHILTLIDFGRGFFVEAETDVRERKSMEWVHVNLTPWQLDGYAFARRDDVYKALELVGTVMVGSSLWVVPLARSTKDPPTLMKWKRHGFIFQSNTVDPIGRSGKLTWEQVSRAKWSLLRILSLVRALDSVKTPIPYGEVIARFEAIHHMFGGPRPPTTRTCCIRCRALRRWWNRVSR